MIPLFALPLLFFYDYVSNKKEIRQSKKYVILNYSIFEEALKEYPEDFERKLDYFFFYRPAKQDIIFKNFFHWVAAQVLYASYELKDKNRREQEKEQKELFLRKGGNAL